MEPPEARASRVEMHLGDCVAGMREHLADASVDVVVTSPPYNLGIAYNTHDDSRPRSSYLEWCAVWAREVRRVLAPGGSFFLNVGSMPSDPYVPYDVLGVMRSIFTLQNTIHWLKSIAVPIDGAATETVVGHYKPINSPRYLNDCHEFIFHLTETGAVPLDRLAIGVPYKDKSNVDRWKGAGAGLHCRGNTWHLPYPTIMRRVRDRPHPATFPPSLPERCLRLHGLNRIGLVVDPFSGLGSTAVACVRLGLDFVGFELDEVYLAEAGRRVAEARQVLPL